MFKSLHQNLLLLLAFSLCLNTYGQFQIPEKPSLNNQTSVYDYVSLLTEQEKNSLEQDLIRYSDSTSTQIVIGIINSTEGENINFLGANWAHDWGIGQEKEDNGVFILMATADKKIAINTGYGVEHLLTDALSKRIIENDILPYFKQGEFASGLQNGVLAIYQVLEGSYTNNQPKSTKPDKLSGLMKFVFIILIVFIIIAIIGRKNNGRGGGRGNNNKNDGFGSLLDIIILSSLGRSSGSGGFGSGGGSFGGGGGFGGGFGGGGFGGGGASGGW